MGSLIVRPCECKYSIMIVETVGLGSPVPGLRISCQPLGIYPVALDSSSVGAIVGGQVRLGCQVLATSGSRLLGSRCNYTGYGWEAFGPVAVETFGNALSLKS